MQELVRRVNGALDKPWSKRVGRPKSLGLYKAVEAACMYLRQNAAQEFIGDVRDTSQPTISRYLAVLVPLVKSVLEEFVPSAADAIEVVKGRVVLVDGTLTPCWSYEEHQELWNKKHKTTGFNAQLISLLDGTAAWISSPLPGKTHDARAFKDTRELDWLRRRRSRKAANSPSPTRNTTRRSRRSARLSSGSLPISRTGRSSTPTTGAHTPPTMTLSTQPAVSSSSQSRGVLNNAPGKQAARPGRARDRSSQILAYSSYRLPAASPHIRHVLSGGCRTVLL